MKILYSALSVAAPGSHGGATHVAEVAGELAKLGHELHVVCSFDPKGGDLRRELQEKAAGGLPVRYYRFPRSDKTALLKYPQIAALARRIGPDLIMERYYNFAGAALLYAHRHKLPALLEVNALMVDPPGSLKNRVDRVLLRRMEWWARKQCEWAGKIVTPLSTTVPPGVSRAKIAELPWGANVERFDRAKISPEEIEKGREKLGIPPEGRVAVFAGSFRHWHGVEKLAEAAFELAPRDPALYFLLLGGGPELQKIRDMIKGRGLEKRILTPGPVEHAEIPALLALADAGVAPFDTTRHLPLRHAGFFWSPLKIFEYMALELPVVTIDLPPLDRIIREGQEGRLVEEGNASQLAKVLGELLAPGREAAQRRAEMGRSARRRVVENYSWAAHARALDGLIKGLARQD